MTTRPNILLILADDLGYSDLGCFGGEIATPNLDRLAREGARMTDFYNTARCSPSRASLLTGRHPHETGVAILNDDERPYGYPGDLSAAHPTIAERLKAEGYGTCLSGKWHVATDTATPNGSWPTRRGFDDFYGILTGADDYFHPRGLYRGEERQPVPDEPGYYFTDAVADHASDFVRRSLADGIPFFSYLAFTAPHWPLHAPEEDVVRYEGVYRAGWDVLREQRHERHVESGLLTPGTPLSDRDPTQPPWEDAREQGWQARRMAVYAAQVERMDRAIGRVLDAVAEGGASDDTFVVFLSDNGASAEDLPPDDAPLFYVRQPSHTVAGEPMRIGNDPQIPPGPESTFCSYGAAWANLSNAPFRRYKRWVHEGGIATPLIAHWPAGGIAGGRLLRSPHQLTDMVPTILDAVGADPGVGPGISMLDPLGGGTAGTGHTLYWEHMGNCAIRRDAWKAVKASDSGWELYDLTIDRAESADLAQDEAERLEELVSAWQTWADDVGVIPWETYGRPRKPA